MEKKAIYRELTKTLNKMGLDELGRCEDCAKVQDSKWKIHLMKSYFLWMISKPLVVCFFSYYYFYLSLSIFFPQKNQEIDTGLLYNSDTV